ncbi:MAG: zinc ribbon domain-containing protein [Terriglobales bacterium]
MAFCNSCGATLDGGAKFCNKCGTTQPGAAAAPATPVFTGAPSGTTQKNGSALKIILIVIAVIVVLGIMGIAAVSFIGYRIAQHSRVRNENGHVRVETPFGTMNTSTDPGEAARNLNIDPYPGAEVVKGTTSNMTMGNMHTATADFETSDAPSAVADFYKSKFPQANVVSSAGDHYTIISTQNKNMLSINIEPKDGKTRIHIARVSGKMVGGESDN